jgi:WD40 repeat protein
MASFSSVLANLFLIERYQHIGSLSGHKGSIYALAFNCTGQYLASAGKFQLKLLLLETHGYEGDDGVKVWDTSNLTELPPPRVGPGSRGPVTAMLWIPQRGSGNEVLCFGTALGYVVFWRQGQSMKLEELHARRLGLGSEISALASTSGPQFVRIAIAMRDGQVHVHQLNANAQLHSTFSIETANFVPMAISFVSNPAKDVQVFGKEGQMYAAPFNGTVFN